MKVHFAAALSLLASAAAACTAQQWGFPRVALQVPSPDGRFVALVRNSPELDPPNQSLWLQKKDGDPVRLERVPPDAFWCDRIVWSADSRRVAFLIADAIVQVYDAESREQVFSGFVGRPSWDVPPRYVLRDFSISEDGSRATFRECEKTWRPVPAERQNRRGTRVESTIGNCADDPITVAFAALPERQFWR